MTPLRRIAIGVIAALPLPVTASWALSATIAFTGGASEITTVAAVLKGSVFPGSQPATYYFQYGRSATYEAQTPPATLPPKTPTVRVAAPLTGLLPATTYHYRTVAVSTSGLSAGQDRTFATRPSPNSFAQMATPRRALYMTPATLSGSLLGSSNAARALTLLASPWPFRAPFATLVPAAETDAYGRFEIAIPPLSASTQVRVATIAPHMVESRPVTVLVAVRVTLRLTATARLGRPRFSGTVTPAEPGLRVRIQQVLHDHRLRDVGSALARGAGAHSRFTVALPVRPSALYRAFAGTLSASLVPNHSRLILIKR